MLTVPINDITKTCINPICFYEFVANENVIVATFITVVGEMDHVLPRICVWDVNTFELVNVSSNGISCYIISGGGSLFFAHMVHIATDFSC